MSLDNYYRTKDLSESAFLYASGKKLITAEKINNKFWFVFNDKPECEKLSDSYWAREAMVNAIAFSDALRTLKDLMFREKG